MKPLGNLPAIDRESGLLTVVIEAPRGSRNKPKYDEKLGVFRLSKVLPAGFAFPHDFGFVPSTRGGDGDPLDVLVLADEPLFPGCVVEARLVGVLEVEQKEKGKTEKNDRLIAAVETPYNPPQVHALDELPEQHLDEIEHFLIAFNQAEGRELAIVGRRDAKRALEIVLEGMRNFDEGRGGIRARAG